MKKILSVTSMLMLGVLTINTANAQVPVIDAAVLGSTAATTAAVGTVNATLLLYLASIDASVNGVKAAVTTDNNANNLAVRTASKALREQIKEDITSDRNSSLSYYTKLGADGGGARADEIQKQGCQSNRVERASVRATDYSRGAARTSTSNILAAGTNDKTSTAMADKRALFQSKFCTQSEIDSGMCGATPTPCSAANENAGLCLAGGDHDAAIVMSPNLNTALKQEAVDRFADNIVYPQRDDMTLKTTPGGVSRYLNRQAEKSVATLGILTVLNSNKPISSTLQTNMKNNTSAEDKVSTEWINAKTANSGTISIDDLLKYDVVSRYGNTMWLARMKGKDSSVKLAEIGMLLSSMHNLAYENHQLMRQLLLVQSTSLAHQINNETKRR